MDGGRRGGAHPTRLPRLISIALPTVAGFRRRVRLPPSKSFTNRALLLAALSPRPFLLREPLDCDDADSMMGALRACGVTFQRTAEGILVSAGTVAPGEIVLDVRDSGTACRFLTAYAASSPSGTFVLTGSRRLRDRPVDGLVDALRSLGADIEYRGQQGYPPLLIRGRSLRGGEAAIDAGRSSQYASALLLVSPRLPEGLSLRLEGRVVSRAYLATTVEALSSVGIAVEGSEKRFRVAPGSALRRFELRVPGDLSSAVPLAAAVAIAGGEIELTNLDWPSQQADAPALTVLEEMGLTLRSRPGGLVASGRVRRPVRTEASGFPDAVPALAAVAAHVEGESVFSGVENLRIKESDRIAAILDLLSASGRAAEYGGGILRLRGGEPSAGAPPMFPTRSDHRIVMAAALLCLRRGGLVENPRAVAKSYPAFFDDLFR